MYNQKAIEKYQQLFLHNDILYIIFVGKTWLTVKEKVMSDLLRKHLERKITIGLQPQKDDGTIKWLAIDFDAHKDEPMEEIRDNVRKTKENLSKVEIESHLEQSGRGYHLWIFFEEPILRSRIEDFIKRFVYHSAEVYAGKTKIRIPLGVYQKDKSIFCGFLNDDFKLVSNQEHYLLNIKPTKLETIKKAKLNLRNDINLVKTKPISQNKKRKIITNQRWVNFNKEKKKIEQPIIDKNKIIKLTENYKHKFILQLLLEMNLSPREIQNIKVKDISLDEQILRIAKFKTIERKVLLIPGHLKEPFNLFMKDKEPKQLLLMSNRGKRYNLRTIQKIKENRINAPEKS